MSIKTIALVLLLLIFVAVALAIAKKLGQRAEPGSDKWPFYVKKPLSQPEQILYHRLISALPEHIVLAQVQVSRILNTGRDEGFKLQRVE